MKTSKKLTLLKSLIEDKIDDHFESIGIYDYLEDNKNEFEFEFKFNQGIEYKVNVIYNISLKGIYLKNNIWVTDQDGFDYCIEDGNLIISNKNYNPAKLTISERIDSIIEHEERKKEEQKEQLYDYNKGVQIQ